MAHVIDALFCIREKGTPAHISDCVPYSQDIAVLMASSGLSGAVLAPCHCAECHHLWNCADRRTQEVVGAVARDPAHLRGLACYDPLRIGESLRWIDDAVNAGQLAGAYVQAETCALGLDASRMYPLYGLCAMLRSPVIVNFASRESWVQRRPQMEVVGADFPELDILLATPPDTDAGSMIRFMQRFPRISFLLYPRELQVSSVLCEYVELEGREHALFRASPEEGWIRAQEEAFALPLSPAAKRAYLFENAMRLFNFFAEASSVEA